MAKGAWGAAIVAGALLVSANVAQAQQGSSFEGPYFSPQPMGSPDSIESYLVFLIGAATKTCDVANYEWSSQPIIDALIAAHKNGIQVRVVADSANDSTSAPYTDQLSQAGIPLVKRAGDTGSGIMHCKYIVVDQSFVWLGSANFTRGSSYNNIENGMAIGSLELAADFENDFGQMFSQQLFSIDKTSASPHPTVTLTSPSGQSVGADVYFSGQDAQNEYAVLAGLVENATQSIQIIAYELKANKTGGTSQLLAALVAAPARGVTVQVILDQSNSVQKSINSGALQALQAAGASVVSYSPTHGLLHDKLFIVDGVHLEFGSFNYTEQAAVSQGNGNDEDFMVLHDPYMANTYQQQFAQVWQQAGGPGTAIVGNGGATPPPVTTQPVPGTATTGTATTGTATTGPATRGTTGTTGSGTGGTATTIPLRSGSTASGSTASGSTASGTAAPAASTGASAGSGGGSGGGCELSRAPGRPGSFAPLALLVAGLLVARRRRARS